MKIILVSGKAQHGKDTVAGFIRDELQAKNKRVLVTHYADLLKFICKNYFGWNEVKDEQGRKLLQHVGTDVIRKQEPDLWVDFVVKMLTYFQSEWDYVIIPDCRFPNEIEKIKQYFSSVHHLRVIRTNFNSELTEEQKNHPSETALNDYQADSYIKNGSDIHNLKHNVTKWVEDMLYE